MKKVLPLIIPLLLFSCKGLPRIVQGGEVKESLTAKLTRHYPKKNSRFIHSILARFPGNNMALLTGVSIIRPDKKEIRSVLMTQEGMLLLDIEKKKKVTVKHAVPPFDREGFALSMADDIGLIFERPTGPPTAFGRDRAGNPIIRYNLKDRGHLDLTSEKGKTTLHLYDKGNSLRRSVTWFTGEGIPPRRVTLQAHGLFGYTLNLELTESGPE